MTLEIPAEIINEATPVVPAFAMTVITSPGLYSLNFFRSAKPDDEASLELMQEMETSDIPIGYRQCIALKSGGTITYLLFIVPKSLASKVGIAAGDLDFLDFELLPDKKNLHGPLNRYGRDYEIFPSSSFGGEKNFLR